MRLRLLIAALACLALLAPTAATAAAQEQGPTGEPTITTQIVTSFDETPIYSTLFLPAGATAEEPVELILRTHGFGGQGERSVGSGTLAKLLDAGYAVLTWDERGFGYSGGEVHLDDPDFEGRDASALIDWIVANVPEIALEAPGDPLIGWSGGSYAGGIQPATAGFDERVDVLAPEISWSDLSYSLEEGDVINIGWGSLLYSAGKATAQSAGLDPRNPAGPQAGGYAQEVDDLFVRGLAANGFDEEQEAFLRGSSIAGYGDEHPTEIPTLVMNGSVDTLFDLRDGFGVFDHVRANGAPAKFIAFCGGHVSCPGSYADADDRTHLDDAIFTWFARHLRGEEVDTGATVEYRTNEGEWRTADDFTPSEAELVTGTAAGTLLSSPATGDPNEDSTIMAAPSPEGDPRALTVELAVADDGPLELVGFPEATLDIAGTGQEATVFVKLVDREAGEVVNLQENPLRLEGLGETQTVTIPMSGIAYTLAEGHHLDAQVATESLMHFTSRTPASLDVAANFEVPVRTRLDAPMTEPLPTATPSPTSTEAPSTGEAEVRRLRGADRIATAIAISQDAHETADTVVLARADQFPDALAGGPLAARLDAPLLLTGRDGLDARVAEEIERLGATGAVLLGGPSALSPAIEGTSPVRASRTSAVTPAPTATTPPSSWPRARRQRRLPRQGRRRRPPPGLGGRGRGLGAGRAPRAADPADRHRDARRRDGGGAA